MKKNIKNQFTSEYNFVNQMHTLRWTLSENLKALRKKSTPLLQFGKQGKTGRNVTVRCYDHSDIVKSSEPLINFLNTDLIGKP